MEFLGLASNLLGKIGEFMVIIVFFCGYLLYVWAFFFHFFLFIPTCLFLVNLQLEPSIPLAIAISNKREASTLQVGKVVSSPLVTA